MCIRELNDQFEIQGAFCIKVWDDDVCDYEILVKGTDFEIDRWDVSDEIMECPISFMYAVDGVLNIELENY